MGMPVIIEIPNEKDNKIFKKIFDYFKKIDEQFSPYKQNSIVTKINDKRLELKNINKDTKLILELAEITKKETDGYFDISKDNYIDPSGIVKGWAIHNASKTLNNLGYKNYCIEAGGDIQTFGLNNNSEKWAIGIRNPFNLKEIVKVVYLSSEGIATSGTCERGNHIYNPKGKIKNEINSITVIGPNIYEADRFATAAFAMGKNGINFIEKQENLEGYMIDTDGIATMTSRFEKYVKQN